MKSLKEALVHKHLDSNVSNPFGLTEKDLIGELKGFSIGVVIRMLEEQSLQGNKPNVKIFQKFANQNKVGGGFDWNKTENGNNFWTDVIYRGDDDVFFTRYPEYKKYNI